MCMYKKCMYNINTIQMEDMTHPSDAITYTHLSSASPLSSTLLRIHTSSHCIQYLIITCN